MAKKKKAAAEASELLEPAMIQRFLVMPPTNGICKMPYDEEVAVIVRTGLAGQQGHTIGSLNSTQIFNDSTTLRHALGTGDDVDGKALQVITVVADTSKDHNTVYRSIEVISGTHDARRYFMETKDTVDQEGDIAHFTDLIQFIAL